MDVIQSAIMTSSLINLPLAKGAHGFTVWRAHTSTSTHTHTHLCQLSAGTLSPSLWDHGKVFQPPRRRHSWDCQYWSASRFSDGFIWCRHSWFREDYGGGWGGHVLSETHGILTSATGLRRCHRSSPAAISSGAAHL